MKTWSFVSIPALGVLSFASLASVVGCKSAPEVAATPSPEIEQDVRAQAESAAPGSAMVGQLYRGIAYDKGEFSDFHVELEKGKCYYFSAAGDETVRSMGLYLWDPSDSRLDSDKSKTRKSFLQHCPKTTGSFKVEAKVLGGAGHYALGVFSKDAPEEEVAAAPPAPAGPDLEKVINDEASATAPGAVQVGNFYNADNGKTDWYTTLDKGKCYWFIGAGDEKIDDFYIYLWDPNNKRIGETKASGKKATYGTCAKESGMFHIQVKTDESAAKFKLGVFAKK